VIIDGLIKINNVQVSLTCFKSAARPAKPVMPSVEANKRVGGPTPRPPSKLPPQGDLSLHLSITAERFGYGRVGSVYPVSIHASGQYCLPPLVIKVASRRRSPNIAREAWFYEEMEHIQGAAIARCYGLFTAEIDADCEVLDWAETDADYDPEKSDTPLEEDYDQYGMNTVFLVVT
jgi:hypothetical protein